MFRYPRGGCFGSRERDTKKRIKQCLSLALSLSEREKKKGCNANKSTEGNPLRGLLRTSPVTSQGPVLEISTDFSALQHEGTARVCVCSKPDDEVPPLFNSQL